MVVALGSLFAGWHPCAAPPLCLNTNSGPPLHSAHPQVDVARLAADTGGLDMSAANQLLPRARRSAQLPAYRHTALSSPATLLSVPLASLLLGGSTGSTGSDLEAGASLAVTAAGSADVLCWWLEQRLVAGGPSEQQGQALLLSPPRKRCCTPTFGSSWSSWIGGLWPQGRQWMCAAGWSAAAAAAVQPRW